MDHQGSLEEGILDSVVREGFSEGVVWGIALFLHSLRCGGSLSRQESAQVVLGTGGTRMASVLAS